jgi:hypothetical protein
LFAALALCLEHGDAGLATIGGHQDCLFHLVQLSSDCGLAAAVLAAAEAGQAAKPPRLLLVPGVTFLTRRTCPSG